MSSSIPGRVKPFPCFFIFFFRLCSAVLRNGFDIPCGLVTKLVIETSHGVHTFPITNKMLFKLNAQALVHYARVITKLKGSTRKSPLGQRRVIRKLV
jgi:hypothetical protein